MALIVQNSVPAADILVDEYIPPSQRLGKTQSLSKGGMMNHSGGNGGRLGNDMASNVGGGLGGRGMAGGALTHPRAGFHMAHGMGEIHQVTTRRGTIVHTDAETTMGTVTLGMGVGAGLAEEDDVDEAQLVETVLGLDGGDMVDGEDGEHGFGEPSFDDVSAVTSEPASLARVDDSSRQGTHHHHNHHLNGSYHDEFDSSAEMVASDLSRERERQREQRERQRRGPGQIPGRNTRTSSGSGNGSMILNMSERRNEVGGVDRGEGEGEGRRGSVGSLSSGGEGVSEVMDEDMAYALQIQMEEIQRARRVSEEHGQRGGRQRHDIDGQGGGNVGADGEGEDEGDVGEEDVGMEGEEGDEGGSADSEMIRRQIAQIEAMTAARERQERGGREGVEEGGEGVFYDDGYTGNGEGGEGEVGDDDYQGEGEPYQDDDDGEDEGRFG